MFKIGGPLSPLQPLRGPTTPSVPRNFKVGTKVGFGLLYSPKLEAIDLSYNLPGHFET